MINTRANLKFVSEKCKRIAQYRNKFTKEQEKEFNKRTFNIQNALGVLWSREILDEKGNPNLNPYEPLPYLHLLGQMEKIAKKVRRIN